MSSAVEGKVGETGGKVQAKWQEALVEVVRIAEAKAWQRLDSALDRLEYATEDYVTDIRNGTRLLRRIVLQDRMRDEMGEER